MTHYFRLSGGGNDFLAQVEPEATPAPEVIRALCRRGLSTGADGLFLLSRSSHGVLMKHFNADGRPAELCLNGTRCAVRLADHLNWGEGRFEIQTDAGAIRGRVLDATRVSLELWRPQTPSPHDLRHEGRKYSGWRLEVGVPHFVLPWPGSMAAAPVEQLGPALRHHSDWAERGANINFVRFVDLGRLEIRTFERGVEAETLACGSGVMASTAAGLAAGQLQLPVTAQTQGGFELQVGDANSTSGDQHWSLTGDARLIAECTLHPGALELPPPPKWTE